VSAEGQEGWLAGPRHRGHFRSPKKPWEETNDTIRILPKYGGSRRGLKRKKIRKKGYGKGFHSKKKRDEKHRHVNARK